MKINKRIGIAVFGFVVLFFTGFYASQKVFQTVLASELEPEISVVESYISIEEAYPYEFPKDSTLFEVLRSQDVSGPDIQQIVEAAKPYYNLAKIRPGIRYSLEFSDGTDAQLKSMDIRFSGMESLIIKKDIAGWVAEKKTEEVELKTATFFGVVKSSLWESALEANMDGLLIAELAEIFAWQVDFAREVRVGDRWRLSVEQKFIRGQPAGWGSILSAEYVNAGQSFVGILFRVDGEDLGYFTPDGSSLRRMFLKSPISYGRITSGFSRKRFHPILKVNRPHMGVDYAARTGTPVKAVGDGRVVFSGWSGGGGNVVKIRHNSLYETAYKHLSRYGKNIRKGTLVKQGQVIGYVGSTGLSTAPHLHFEFFQAGRFVDPVGKKFPSADPVPANLMSNFTGNVSYKMSLLPTWDNLKESL